MKKKLKSTIFQIKTLVTAQPTGLIKTLQKLRMKLVSNELFIFSINLIRWKNKRPSGTMSAEFAYCFSIHRKSAPSIGSKWRPFGPPNFVWSLVIPHSGEGREKNENHAGNKNWFIRSFFHQKDIIYSRLMALIFYE